jgi:hypothetical protein
MNLAHIVILARKSSTMEAWTLPTGLLGKILDSIIRSVGRVQGITAILSVRSKVASVRSKQKIPHLWITSVGGVQATRELSPCPTACRTVASHSPSAKDRPLLQGSPAASYRGRSPARSASGQAPDLNSQRPPASRSAPFFSGCLSPASRVRRSP